MSDSKRVTRETLTNVIRNAYEYGLDPEEAVGRLWRTLPADSPWRDMTPEEWDRRALHEPQTAAARNLLNLHQRNADHLDEWCMADDEPWPCSFVVALAQIEVEAVAADRKVWNESPAAPHKG